MCSISTGILDRNEGDSALLEHSFVFRKLIGLIFVQILGRHVILRHLMGVHFLLVSVIGAFHSADRVSLERVPFLKQLVDTL